MDQPTQFHLSAAERNWFSIQAQYDTNEKTYNLLRWSGAVFQVRPGPDARTAISSNTSRSSWHIRYRAQRSKSDSRVEDESHPRPPALPSLKTRPSTLPQCTRTRLSTHLPGANNPPPPPTRQTTEQSSMFALPSDHRSRSGKPLPWRHWLWKPLTWVSVGLRFFLTRAYHAGCGPNFRPAECAHDGWQACPPRAWRGAPPAPGPPAAGPRRRRRRRRGRLQGGWGWWGLKSGGGGGGDAVVAAAGGRRSTARRGRTRRPPPLLHTRPRATPHPHSGAGRVSPVLPCRAMAGVSPPNTQTSMPPAPPPTPDPAPPSAPCRPPRGASAPAAGAGGVVPAGVFRSSTPGRDGPGRTGPGWMRQRRHSESAAVPVPSPRQPAGRPPGEPRPCTSDGHLRPGRPPPVRVRRRTAFLARTPGRHAAAAERPRARAGPFHLPAQGHMPAQARSSSHPTRSSSP
jgi:hypothetical protein